MYSIAIQELYQVTTSDKIGYRSSQVKVIFYILFFTNFVFRDLDLSVKCSNELNHTYVQPGRTKLFS